MREVLSRLLMPFLPERSLCGHRANQLSLAVLAAFALMLSPPVLAQEADETDEGIEAVDEDTEVVIVTGSRLKRNTYTSVSPLQIITAEVSREAGLIDAADILQESTASAGQQIDLTFHGFVLDDGPGSVTANLRGLGSARTLVMINGRRVAPAGVEGAPSAPSLDVIPGLLVQNYDQLLDGASSVYGSDAVAGVINAILYKDFDGLELEMFPRFSAHGSDRENVFGARWGMNFDRGFVGVGAQYTTLDPIALSDRPWTSDCARNVEVDQGGRVRHQDRYYSTTFGMRTDDCALGSLAGRVIVPTRSGSVYYTPGYSNGGWGDFSEANTFGPIGVDGDGDGQTDVSYRDYDINGRDLFAHLRAERTTANAMAYGEYTLEGEMNLTPYFEVLYSTREVHTNGGAYQLFPYVPARNPYNLCNPEGQGVDCGLAEDALWLNPNYQRQFINVYGVPPTAFGFLFNGPIGPARTRPIVSVRGDRTLNDVSVTQWRYVAGLSGDLPALNVGTLYDWTFDASVTHSSSSGDSHRPGVREDRLELAMGTYSTTNTPCENDTGEELAADVVPGCVPVNMFAPSLYTGVIGDFGSPVERNYVFDSRDFGTEYQQTVLTAYATGALFELPSGAVSAGFGLEYRLDNIDSIPDDVARDGLFFGYFADGGAVGDKTTREAFAEVEVPLLFGSTTGSINMSARWTDDEFYGGAWTGATKIGWNPVDSLLLRATFGTSYRAPNLRELFLQAQTGFTQVSDPCLIPGDAIDPLSGGYNPELDLREAHLLANCRAQGVDPTLATNNGNNTFSVEVAGGGALDLDEETSESLSLGFAWEQPFTNAFDLQVSAYYYAIEIENTIIEPSAGYIVFDCYYSETGSSAFCGRIRRDADPMQPFINYIDQGFINRDNQTVRGVDTNINFQTTLTVFDRPVDVQFDTTVHRQIEFTTLFLNEAGDRAYNARHREWYFPEFKAQMALRVDYDRWRASWQARLHGRVQQEVTAVDEWSDINGSSDTCLGPPDDVLCRDVGSVGNYWLHHLSGSYDADTWRLTLGVRNLFDEPPPEVDGSEISSTSNVPLGAGYDFLGRIYFLGASIKLGGSG